MSSIAYYQDDRDYRLSAQRDKRRVEEKSKYVISEDISKKIKKINEKKKVNEKWTKDACGKEAKKYNRKKDFRVGSVVAYNKALKNGWMEDISSHFMEEPIKKEKVSNLTKSLSN